MQTERIDKAYGQVENHKACKTWFDRQQDFQFFTPGLLYWHMDVDRDLIEDFIACTPLMRSERPKRLVSEFELFDVTPAISSIHTPKGDMLYDIARTIYICPKESWDKLDEFLSTVGFVNPKTKLFSRSIRQQDLLIPDYGAIKSGSPSLGDITVVSYALATNDFFSVWRQDTNSGVYQSPKACLLSPSEVVIRDGILFYKER